MLGDIPLALQTVYAELLEQCATADFDAQFPEPGAFTPKMIRGRRYWYFQGRENGLRTQRYVGPESQRILDRIAHHRRAHDSRQERRKLVSTLVRSAPLPQPRDTAGRVLESLARAGVFRLRGVLVGTLAFQCYAAMLGSRLPNSALQTDDVDIGQFLEVSKAVEGEIPDMLAVLREVDSSFRRVPYAHDSGRTAVYQAKDVRVDFLTPSRVAGTNAPQRLPALGTDAQQLQHFDFLIREPEPAIVLYGAGVYVTVPSPQRFAVHKLILSSIRQSGTAKSPKDIQQAEALLGVLLRRRPEDLKSAWREAHERGPKWRRRMLQGLGSIDQVVRDEVLKLADLRRSAIAGLGLEFDSSPAYYDFERDVVTFTARAGGQVVRCMVSRESLDDHFGADGLDRKSRLEQFRKHRDTIEAALRRKYLEWPVEAPGTVLLKTSDVETLKDRHQKVGARERRSP